jgi:hypothetical protein
MGTLNWSPVAVGQFFMAWVAHRLDSRKAHFEID